MRLEDKRTCTQTAARTFRADVDQVLTTMIDASRDLAAAPLRLILCRPTSEKSEQFRFRHALVGQFNKPRLADRFLQQSLLEVFRCFLQGEGKSFILTALSDAGGSGAKPCGGEERDTLVSRSRSRAKRTIAGFGPSNTLSYIACNDKRAFGGDVKTSTSGANSCLLWGCSASVILANPMIIHIAHHSPFSQPQSRRERPPWPG